MFLKLFYKIEEKGERLFYITNRVWINPHVPNNTTTRTLWIQKFFCLYTNQADNGSLTWYMYAKLKRKTLISAIAPTNPSFKTSMITLLFPDDVN
jgi:hypothetical protein